MPDFSHQVASNPSADFHSFNNSTQPITGSNIVPYNLSDGVNLQTMGNQGNPNEQRSHPVSLSGVGFMDTLVNDGLQSQDSFGMWVNQIMSDSPCSIDESALESSISSVNEPYSSLAVDNQQVSLPEQIFNLTEVSPSWVSSTEKSKVSFSIPRIYLQLFSVWVYLS